MLLLLSSLLQNLELCPFVLQIPVDFFYISQLHFSLNEYSNTTDFSGTLGSMLNTFMCKRIVFLFICHSMFY